jgi:ankyrin repeat protein
MDARALPHRTSVEDYAILAADLVRAYRSGDTVALRRLTEHYRLERPLTRDDVRTSVAKRLGKLSGPAGTADFALPAAQTLVADSFGFDDWAALVDHLDALKREESPVSIFEAAADAIIAGDLTGLESLLRDQPQLIRTRSTRKHHATLLHYMSANGVEDFRQRTPPNAVKVAQTLLTAGAEVDAVLADGESTTLGLVATSAHPAVMGVQLRLLETLLEAGAAVDGIPGGWNPLTAALANGRGEAAAFLADRGARLALEGAAGVGRLDLVKGFFNPDGSLTPNATRAQLSSGFAWACEYGRSAVVAFLLDTGFAIDGKLRHDGQTGLHWAAYGGHEEVVRLLLERNAPMNATDTMYGGTPLGWAIYGWAEEVPEFRAGRYHEVVSLLVAAGATVEREWLDEYERGLPLVERIRGDPRMLAALQGRL